MDPPTSQALSVKVKAASLTTAKMPTRVKSMVMLVVTDRFVTGRIDFRSKTGLRASSRAGRSGREQFNMTELHGAIWESKYLMVKTLSEHCNEMFFFLFFI